ncbi:IS110 family transposase [Sphingomonas canadensis]|uniref:IS110 family transposase n=1 Tax=Sphingomonas canadensis TaxID=1219257 RepID=A0ABW3HAB8_9SPHN|nr:IS110 family transposase [Sphingomonas canadensis]MCW3837383.1 IS110 family transposase [Sphingomonas canadensis]
MPQPDLFVGIDVAKDELVVHLHPAGTQWRIANGKAGLATLGRRLARLAGTACLRVGFEASGGYERKLAILLDRLGLAAYLLDPARVRSFARAERQIAKTDPLDAAVIARCLAALHPQLVPHVHDAQAIRLAEHVRMRDLAVAQAVQLGNQLDTIADAAMRRLISSQIARLKALALRIAKAIAALIAASPRLAARDALLRTAPGVGPAVAACLLARMPELGRLSSRQAAALAGLAPFDRQSGNTSRPGRCSGGRPSVRRALYLAALSIVRTGKGHLAETAQRLRNNGKPFKLAIVATMRKLIITLNAMLKLNNPYQPN